MKGPVSDFDPEEYSERYTFRKGMAYNKRHPDKPLTPQSRPNQHGRDYSYYQLTRNDGVRCKVSSALVSGRVTKVGDLYQINHYPRGWEARAGFPAYLFHPGKKLIRRVGFKSPRVSPVDLKPNKCDQYKLLTPDGYRWYHHEDLFL